MVLPFALVALTRRFAYTPAPVTSYRRKGAIATLCRAVFFIPPACPKPNWRKYLTVVHLPSEQSQPNRPYADTHSDILPDWLLLTTRHFCHIIATFQR